MKKRFLFPVAMLFSLGMASAALAQAPKTEPTNAQRQTMGERHVKMAAMHTKMAACLESSKLLSECRQEMLDSCSSNFGGQCPMMGKGPMGGGLMGGKGKGMMNGSWMDWMMNPAPDDAAPAKPTK